MQSSERHTIIDSISHLFCDDLYRSGSLGGNVENSFFGQKTTRPSTYRDEIWTTHTRDQGASTLRNMQMGNSPNSKKFKFLTNFLKIHISKTGKDFFAKFSAFLGVEGPHKIHS